MPRGRIVGYKGSYIQEVIFYVLEKLPILFPEILNQNFHQPWMRDPFSPHFHRHWLFLVFQYMPPSQVWGDSLLFLTFKWQWKLFYMPIGHSYICLLQKCLFISAHFIRLVFLLLSFSILYMCAYMCICIYIASTLHLACGVQMFFPIQ